MTPAKVVRARGVVERILNEERVQFDEYRSLVGLLEHMLLFVAEGAGQGVGSDLMYFMYGTKFRAGARYGPTTRMVFTALQMPVVRRWASILLSSAGCYLHRAVTLLAAAIPPLPELFRGTVWKSARPPLQHCFSLWSDAAVEKDSGGLGGLVPRR